MYKIVFWLGIICIPKYYMPATKLVNLSFFQTFKWRKYTSTIKIKFWKVFSAHTAHWSFTTHVTTTQGQDTEHFLNFRRSLGPTLSIPSPRGKQWSDFFHSVMPVLPLHRSRIKHKQCVSRLLLNFVSVRFTHVVGCMSNAFFFNHWVAFHFMNIPQCIQSTVNDI